ncbi:hypothetical protein U3A55_08335 [Salarchaeum sp. III]|uniref:hypothetical protein n=1 Tax=Salarchaeum sp. III TaxID=3107927 RepID=UPI002EDA5C60
MQVQIQSFDYDATKIAEMEDKLNTVLSHYDVVDTTITRREDELLVFVFYEE